MVDLETEAERGLLSALLVEERQWSDTQVIVDETKKRYDMRRRKQRLRQGLQAIVHNQGAGDPSGEVTRAGMQRLHEQALEVHDMVMPRPTETGPHAPR